MTAKPDRLPDHHTGVASETSKTTARIRRVIGSALLIGTLGFVTACALPAIAPRETPPTGPTDPAPTSDLTEEDAAAWLDSTIPASLARHGLAGATVAIVADGEVVATRGYGSSDLGGPDFAAGDFEGTGGAIAVDPESDLFRIGSVSKLITAAAVMQLVENGDLDLDTDIAEYLGEDTPSTIEEPITTRHLLTHTAGFEDRVRGLITTTPHETTLRDEVVIDPPEQVFEPGTTPAYSNYSSTVAGYLVEVLSGQSFNDYVDEHIFAPTGMETATFEQPAEGVSNGYDAVFAPPVGFEYLSAEPPGSMSASATDMAAFMLASLGESQGPGELLAPETQAEMFEPALTENELGGLIGAPQTAIAWFLHGADAGLATHGGDTRAFHSDLALFPDENAGIFLSFNTTGTGGTMAARAELLLGFQQRYLDADTPEPTERTASSNERAALVAGNYETTRSSYSTFAAMTRHLAAMPITNNGDGTISSPALTTLGGVPRYFEEVEASETASVWQEVGGAYRIAFDIEDGAVQALSLGPATTFHPAPVSTAFLTPVSTLASLVIVTVLIAWPIGAVVRRRHGVSIKSWSRTRKTLRVLTHLGLVMTLVASAAWMIVLTLVSGFMIAPDWFIRATQVMTLLPALAIVPATAQVVTTIRNRGGFWATAANILIALSLIGFTWSAWAIGMFHLSTSY